MKLIRGCEKMAEASISMMIQRLGILLQSVIKEHDWDSKVSATQIKVLMYIALKCENGEKVFQKDIECEFGTKSSSVSSILNSLEKKDYIRREKVEYDARLKSIVLSGEVYSKLTEIRNFWNDVEKTIQDTLTPAEHIVFCQCMEKIMAALQEKKTSGN